MLQTDILYIQNYLRWKMITHDRALYTCCFIGHREIDETEDLRTKLYETIERLIICESIDTFLFGSKSRFDSLSLELVTALKEKYPHIKRVCVRAEFPVICDEYEAYLKKSYEHTYYPERLSGTGRAAYVMRNREMIDKSSFCIFYYDEKNVSPLRKSGTKTALDYARKKKKQIIMLPENKK